MERSRNSTKSVLRSQLECEFARDGIEPLAKQLLEISPTTAETTDLRNPRRVIRAIERVRSGSVDPTYTPSKSTHSPFDHYIVGLMIKRAVLHARIVERLIQWTKMDGNKRSNHFYIRDIRLRITLLVQLVIRK
ncbi:MAG: hypothetical protein Ct9H300mP19_17300 [Dehalococcoidia bacterium]|nr:MAG: hypothetical protein Ct9H300mP19_17300 [Dehalococcoidia bacterium]